MCLFLKLCPRPRKTPNQGAGLCYGPRGQGQILCPVHLLAQPMEEGEERDRLLPSRTKGSGSSGEGTRGDTPFALWVGGCWGGGEGWIRPSRPGRKQWELMFHLEPRAQGSFFSGASRRRRWEDERAFLP